MEVGRNYHIGRYDKGQPLFLLCKEEFDEWTEYQVHSTRFTKHEAYIMVRLCKMQFGDHFCMVEKVDDRDRSERK